MRSVRPRRPSADAPRVREGEAGPRLNRALEQRYLGAAVIGLAILLLWTCKLIMAQWVG